MKLFIKNMVCGRCKKVVKDIFHDLGLQITEVELGEVELDGELAKSKKAALQQALTEAGFELMDDRNSKLIDQIKTMIIRWVH